MIRVSGLHEQLEAAALVETSPDGLSAREQLARIGQIIRGQLETAAKLLADDLLPALAARGIQIRDWNSLDAETKRLGAQVLPPLGLPGGDAAGGRSGAPVPVPVEPVAVAGGRGARSRDQGAQVRAHQGPGDPAALRPVREPSIPTAPAPCGVDGRRRTSCRSSSSSPPTSTICSRAWRSWGPTRFASRATWTIDILEDEAHDLLSIVDREIRRRRFGACVRLEVAAGIPERIRRLLIEKLAIDEEDVYESSGPLGLRGADVDRGAGAPRAARPAVRGAAPAASWARRPIPSR